MLTLEIELLTGVYRAALPDGSGAEWPPHPERVFSALVQAWADGGKAPEERAALEWLEALEPPAIEASSAWERTSPTVFVPPNDPRGDQVTVLPERRRRQARTFAARVPDSPVVRMHWDASPSDDAVQALDALSRRVASVGHSSSLVRCRFLRSAERGPAFRPDGNGSWLLRAAYGGRLNDLERWLSDDGGRKRPERPRTLRTVAYADPDEGTETGERPESVFGGPDDWFVFEDAGDRSKGPPDLLAFAHVARRVRDALMAASAQPAPEILSGHAPGGGPSSRPHLAVVPLANVGWERSTGDLIGFALVLPRASSREERTIVLDALGRFVLREGERRTATLHLSRTLRWTVEYAPVPSRASLRPDRYGRAAKAWASVTPVFLDRFPEHGDAIEEARIVAAACVNIGLPEPVEIELHKHSAVRGAPSAYFARRTSPGWTFPRDARFRDRPRRHVVLRFDRPVRGPILLGAGRYHGLGLLMPLSEER